MIGSSLGLGIGLQGQPKQYAEMAYKKLASDAAVKKQQADSDKEFLKLYKDNVFVKPGYVLPAESDQYQELLATYAAKINQMHIDRNYSGAVQTLNELKMKSQPFLTNYKVVDEARKKQAELAIDSDAINTLYTTRDRNEFNRILQNPYTGIAYDSESGVINPTMFKRSNLESEIKTKLLDTEFELSKTTQKDAAGKPMNMFVLPESIKAAKITNLVNDPSIRQSYMVSMQKSLDGLDRETANTMISQKINEDARVIFDGLTRYKNTSAGINIVNNMGGDKTVAPFIAGGRGTINFYDDKTKVKTRASFNFGNIESVEAAGANFYNKDGRRLQSPDVTNYTFGQTQFVPVLKEKFTDEQLKKLYSILEKDGRKDLIEQGTTLINQFNSNSSDAVIPDGLDEYIASYFPNNVDIKTITSGQDKQGNPVYKMSEITKHEQVIKSSNEDEAKKNKLIKEMNSERDKFKGELKTKSTSQPKTPAPKTGTKNEFEQYFRKSKTLENK